jgi:uncharacterized protein
MTFPQDSMSEDIPRELRFCFRHVVLQPTTACNLNCSYCYLPDRRKSTKMTVEVASSVASSIEGVPHSITLVWHGGEPLACGLSTFRELVKSFHNLRKGGRVSHNVQTNGTLITQEWCDFFKDEGFTIGVSLDGDVNQNSNRVTWGKSPSHASVMRGIERLQKNDLDFGIIAVVNVSNIDNPHTFYDFFASLNCRSLSVNVEEQEGLNRLSEGLASNKVRWFWSELFKAWLAKPVIRIREIDSALGWMESVCKAQKPQRTFTRDFWPTVSSNGDVVVLSPEFMAVRENEQSQFVVGNVLRTPLTEIVYESMSASYVQDFFIGVGECLKTCSYYSFCGGGQASNKYFELGDIKATETAHCRNSKQFVVDAILASLSNQ